MAPARAPLTFMRAWQHHAAVASNATSITRIDPLVVLGAITILVAVATAVAQYRVAERYRKADKADQARRDQQEAQRAEEEALMRRRRASQESWREAYKECREILKQLQDIESEVRAQGPLTHDQIEEHEPGRMRWRLENVSDCPEALSAPLQKVVEAVAIFRSIHIPSDGEVTKEYDNRVGSTPKGDPAPLIESKKIGKAAIEQYQAAENLHSVIYAALKVINIERGESLVP